MLLFEKTWRCWPKPGGGKRFLALGLLVEAEKQRCQHTLDCGTFWVGAQFGRGFLLGSTNWSVQDNLSGM